MPVTAHRAIGDNQEVKGTGKGKGAAGGYIFSWQDMGSKHAPLEPDQPPPYTQQEIRDLEKAIQNSVDVFDNVTPPPNPL